MNKGDMVEFLCRLPSGYFHIFVGTIEKVYGDKKLYDIRTVSGQLYKAVPEQLIVE